MISRSKAGSLPRAGCGKRRRLLAALAPLALLAPAADATNAQAPEPVVAKTLERSPAAVGDYWTAEKMRKAQPIERQRDALPARRTLSRPAEPSRRSAQQADASTDPGRMHGKVFFTLPAQGDFQCSATVVRSAGRNLVISAAHCMYDEVGQRFATNWMFVPGYRDGQKPFGEWVAQRLATTSRFQSSGDERYDVGVAVLHRDPSGRGIQDVVGARGIAFNRPRGQLYRAFGYPADTPFDGEHLYRCDSPYEGDDQAFPPPRPIRIGCDMTAGASGGGWVIDDRVVVSVTSYAYDPCPPILCDEHEKLFGPYFGDTIRELYRANRGRPLECGGRVVTHRGTRGPDQLTGTRGDDVIHGLGDDDVLRGRAGDDVICGGRGDDRLLGGRGDNRIFAGPGDDRVVVRAPGRNRVVAGKGRNVIRCGRGRDLVITNQRSRVHRSCNQVIRR